MNHIPIHFSRECREIMGTGGGFGGFRGRERGGIRSGGSRGCDGDDDDDDIVLVSSARTKAKGGDLFIGVTHVGDDAANSRTDFARRDLRFRRVFAKSHRGDEL